ncbi:MAG: LacI family DNA-binding transcriptional regulator [Chthoniobacteraceae bacterium]
MKSIAEKAKVSVMTVSLALRNHSRISESTKKKVLATAEELGYRPNPMVSNLMVHIRSSRPVPYQANLAYVTAFISENDWKNHSVAVRAYRGMNRRASDVGYLIDHFWLREPGMDPQRFRKVLRSRNIQGVILAPLPEAGRLDHMDWSEWSAVALGNSLLSPLLHRVTHHQYHGMSLVLHKLEEKGYRRIGFVTNEFVDNKVDRAFSSCMAGYQLRLPAKHRVPIYFQKVDSSIPFGAWMEKYKPDVVIGHDDLVYRLKDLGLSIPRDVAVAHLGVPSACEPSLSGLNQNWELAGAAAVDALVAQIYRNERGVPEHPQTIMHEGYWVEGSSTPGK